jgi:hypothetical protein
MRVRKGAVAASALMLAWCLSAPRAWAQFASSIEGAVADPSGALVPGAAVTITNEATGVTQTAGTTTAGYYRFPALPGGLYTVKVSMSGFKSWVREHIRVESTQTRTVNVALELGAAGSEEVTVTGDAPLVETSQGRVSGLIEGGQVQDLPLVGRNFLNLVVLTPGVTGRVTGGTQSYAQSSSDLYNNEFGVGMNANGARTESNNFMVDSATVSSSQRNGVANINPNSESVEEVRVLVNNFSAEYGRNGSVLVNVITKSGANDFHGSLGAYYTNNKLQAKNHFQKQQANFEHPDFGRTELSWGLGGPIRREQTFFFLSGDVLRSDVAVSGPRQILTDEFKRFMQQARPNNISTQIARDFPASFTPDRNFRTAGQLLSSSCTGATLIDSPIGPVPCNLRVTGEGTWNETSPRNGFQWTARVDHHFNQGRDRLYASFNRTTTEKVGNPAAGPEVYPGFTGMGPTSSLQLNSNWTKIFSSALVNEMQFSWVRPAGEVDNPHPEVPGISVTGIAGYQVGWGPNQFVQNSFVWSDVVTWTRGAHSLKMGAGYTREHADNDSARAITRPTFVFDSVFDFAADRPTSESQIAIDPRTGVEPASIKRFHRTQSVSAFVHDDWKVGPHLTLSAGLRYEGFLNIRDASDGIMTNLVFGSDTGNLRNDLLTARMVERAYYLDGGLWDGGQHTLAPRLSFAWDPTRTGRMSIRGGVGRFYERMSNQIWDSEHQNLPGFGSASVSIFQPVRPLFSLGTGASQPPYGYNYPAGLSAGVNQYGGLLTGTGAVHVVDGDIGTMYLDNWFLGVQRGIGNWAMVEANYIGSRGRDMYVKRDINRFAGDLLDGRLDRILPGFSSIGYTDASHESRYHGLALGLRVNRRDLTLGAAYTLGNAVDQSSGSTPAQRPDAHGPDDQDEGPSDHDVRHKVALSWNWKIPGPSSGTAKALLGGWQLGGVLVGQSGTPYSVVCTRGFVAVRNAAGAIVGNSGCDYNLDGTNLDRPNVPSFGDSRSGSNDDFLNGIFRASDFPAPGLGQNGALSRNTFRGPRYFNVDLALVKGFRVPFVVGSGADVQLRLEAFNAFDTLNLFNPVNNLADPLFGRSTTALSGRILQFSARFTF